MRLRYRLLLAGDVQGVNLRRQINQYAKSHDLAGWIMNLPDGSVKLELEGEENNLDIALRWILSDGAEVAVIKSKQIEVIAVKDDTEFNIIR